MGKKSSEEAKAGFVMKPEEWVDLWETFDRAVERIAAAAAPPLDDAQNRRE